MKNIINTQKANENQFPTNGNCKKVKDLTTGKEYGSITETAIVIEVTAQAVSSAIKNKTLCKGHRLVLVKDLHDNIEVLCEESAKANARAEKAIARAVNAEAKLSEMEELRAKAKAYDKLMADQEAKRKAERARIEKERKEEEKRQAKITKLEDKIERLETRIDEERAKTQNLVTKRNKALDELKALMDNRKEVE